MQVFSKKPVRSVTVNAQANNLNISEEIKKLEGQCGKIPDIQKFLLATDGSVTAALDVFFGNISVKVLSCGFMPAGEFSSGETEEIYCRAALISSGRKPLIFASSLIYFNDKDMPAGFKEDIVSSSAALGRIIKKYNIETRREILSAGVEPDSQDLAELLQSDEKLLGRTYTIISRSKPLMRIKEIFPADYFKN
jgi:chorismate-pyruvate lyase